LSRDSVAHKLRDVSSQHALTHGRETTSPRMMRKTTPALVPLGCTMAVLVASSTAFAQATPLPESVLIGGFTFHPSIELRVRGEYRQTPFDIGGVYFTRAAVLEDDFKSNLPPHFEGATYLTPLYSNQWAATSRARIGLSVDRGAVTASLMLQDARTIAGANTYGFGITQNEYLNNLGLFEGYVDVHAKQRRVWFRFGRQRIVWGDGRLVGEGDFTQTPRAFDALRMGLSFKRIDIDAFAALIGSSLSTGLGGLAGGTGSANVPASPLPATTGSQLYGLRAVWHAAPLFHAEIGALARIVRPPTAIDLTPSDTFVLSARLSGDKRGVRYSVEGAYELGQVSSYGVNRDLSAFALAGRATWETALPWHMTFGAEAAYASGDDGSIDPAAKQTRFDPIAPDKRPNHNLMGLYAWSNLILAGGDITVRPTEPIGLDVGYRFVGLADPNGRWTSASLTAIGSSSKNKSHVLGHQIDAAISMRFWQPLTIDAGYGLFVTGDGAKNILEASSRGRLGAQHFGYVQATLKAP
jgi:Alginate export